MKHACLSSVIGLCIAASAAAQGIRHEPSAPAPGQITADAAVSDARRFLNICNLPAPSAGVRSRLDHKINGVIWDVSFGGDYEVNIDAGNGQPVFFDNNRRTWQRIHNRQKISSPVPADRKSATDRLWHLARAIGLPPQAYLARLDINARGTEATFSVRPHGYHFIGRANVMALVLDPQDGQLVFLAQHWNLVPVSWTRRLTRDQATARARTARRNWYARRSTVPYTRPRGARLAASPPTLGYVEPNGAFGGTASQRTSTPKVRLAWSVPIGDESVYVDAGDGTVLGGEQFK